MTLAWYETKLNSLIMGLLLVNKSRKTLKTKHELTTFGLQLMSKKYGKKCPWKNSNRWKKRRETPKRNPFWQLWSVDKARSMQNLVHFSEDQKHCVMACVFEKWLCLPTAKDSNQFFDHMKYFQRELAPCCSFKHFLNLINHFSLETTNSHQW